jgi:lantibiotic transport system permease protein
MSPLLRALSAEALKLRHTLALRMCAIAPAVVVGLFVLQVALLKHTSHTPDDPVKVWLSFSENILTLWSILMLPLFVTLQSALLAGLEHGDHHWKHLLALPVPRRVHYLAKLLMMIAMVMAATVFLAMLICLGGLLLSQVQPGFGLAGPPPWAYLTQKSAAIFAASLWMVALQIWIAIRWSSFTVAVSIGMTATVIGMMVIQSRLFAPWYPWSMPTMAIAFNGEYTQFVTLAGVIGGALVAGAGLLDFRQRELS